MRACVSMAAWQRGSVIESTEPLPGRGLRIGETRDIRPSTICIRIRDIPAKEFSSWPADCRPWGNSA